MKSFNLYLNFIVIILLLKVILSCSQEPDEKNKIRTRELELNELDSIITNLTIQGNKIYTTKRGIYYMVKTEGDGVTPQEGDTCSVEYRGFFNNKLIDNTEIHKNKTWIFPYRYSKEVHPVLGLLDVISYMNKGAEFEIYIPSDYAYGAKGSNEIPPFSTLFYKVTMKNVAPKKPGPK